MDLTNLAQLKTCLKLAGIKPNKILGQHFLVDSIVLGKVIESASITKDAQVLEIGPGPGVLTLELAKKAKKVIAIEKDDQFAEMLENYKEANLEVLNQDFLQFNLDNIGKYSVVANLPYSITSKTIQKLLTSQNRAQKITLLIQKEVADRITAKPGKMSVLAFSVQYFASAEIIDIVQPSSFYPQPKVNSAIIEIVPQNRPAFLAEEKKLFRLIKAGFSEKRKKLQNSLSASLQIDKQSIAKILSDLGIDGNTRAQELSIDDWHKLYLSFLSQKII